MGNKNFIYGSAEIFLPNLIEVCPDAIIGVNKKGVIIIFNPAAAALTKHSVDAVLGKMHITKIYNSLEVARSVKAAIYSKKYGGQNRLSGYETEIIDSAGNLIPIRLSAALFIEEGEEAGSIGFFHDLTTQKKLEEKLRKLSITDGLTGLYNQRHFYSLLSAELSRARRHNRNMSLIGFDLDKFKQCNDIFGHLEGDNALRLIGDVLNTETRKSDISFRYGGDEFFVILPETDLDQALKVAEKIRRKFNVCWPFDLALGNAGQFRVTLSMGVIQYANEEEVNELIKKLDILIYEAKKAGGNQVTFRR